MPIITIYQGASGEGQELAETVADALGYRCVGREVLVEASRRYRIPEAKLNEIVEKGPHWWERLLQDLRPYRIALQAALCELAQDGQLVYHGHLGHELLPGIEHVLKVLLTASIEHRIEQIRARQNLTDAAARHYLEEIDKARSHRLMAMFGTDWRDPNRYDLVLNMGKMRRDGAKRVIGRQRSSKSISSLPHPIKLSRISPLDLGSMPRYWHRRTFEDRPSKFAPMVSIFTSRVESTTGWKTKS
jgi:cytidylate kinase